MPTQVLPITDLAKAGVIQDSPSVSLPPNVFSDVSNVRFRDGAIRKMEGETELFPIRDHVVDPNTATIVYLAHWRGPFNNWYVVVQDNGNIWLHDIDDDYRAYTAGTIGGGMDPNANYQHTLFNGGFNFVLNNGVSTPVYITDVDRSVPGVNPTIAVELPNWDSYLAQENVVSQVWGADTEEIPLGRAVSLDLFTEDTMTTDMIGEQRIVYRVIPRDPSLPILTYSLSRLERADDTGTYSTPSDALFSIRQDLDNWVIIPRLRSTNPAMPVTGAEPGDTIEIAIQERPEIVVTAGVIRAYGSLLVAGNLREVAGTRIVRNLAGLIRTSDVAPPGSIPANWNPFRNGANTADEFTLSATGTVQDMVELQGNLFIYTTDSIHSLQQTGGNIPFGVRPVTDSYGADNTGSVLEVDGRHIVVGSDDVYVFAGHPGSISSIADARVRHHALFNSGEPVRILRYNRFDELWFYTPNQSLMLIWNYRDNTWSVRNQSTAAVGNTAPGTLIFVDNRSSEVAPPLIYRTDPDTFTDYGMQNTESFIERKRLAITPEFTTETLVSVGILSEGNAAFQVSAVGTSRPAEVRVLPDDDPNPTPFVSQDNYKADIRTHGRLLNYRIRDTSTGEGWAIAGLQFDIGTGGTR